jgi:DNA-binding SARP family transcriptional activator
VRFRILGPLEITDDAGRPVAVTRRLHRSALSLLLLNAGRPCSTSSLAAGLWGDNPPLSPDVSLRSCVYGIRKGLPDARRLRTHPAGYLITAGPGELDLDDFRDLARRGRFALDGGDPRLAAALLSRAVKLWREPPLADLPAIPARDRLLGERKEAQDALTDARLAVGEHRQVLTDLRAVVAADPLHEHAWAQLITALYRTGARTEALAAFGRLRMTLISAYGIDPGPELQELHRRVLADDPDLMLRADQAPAQPAPMREPAGAVREPAGAAREPAAPVPSPAVAARQPAAQAPPAAEAPPAAQATPAPAAAEPGAWQPRCQLPRAVEDFTGRAAELARLTNMLSGKGVAIPVVTGMLGTGKTALAVQAAHAAKARFPHGQLYACLDDDGRPRDPQVVLGELLRGLGVPGGGIPATRFEREALYRSVLAGRRVLVLADGAGSAAQVRPLLPGTPGSAVVVTSRARLPDLEGARFIELGGLHPANSVLLLARISGRAIASADWDDDQDSDSEAEAATAIAAACGHLPLALRIAGARLADDPELTVTDLAALLADESRRLDELTVGAASVRTRLGTAAGGVSTPARRALALLAAAGPVETPGSVIASMGNPGGGKVAPELADAGLLYRSYGRGQDGDASYTIHPLVRAYAGELSDQTRAHQARAHQARADQAPPHSGLASSRRITTRVGERRTTSRNPARSYSRREPKNMKSS